MVEDRVNTGYDIMVVDPHDRSLRRPQRHMKGGTPFRNIDLFPAKHRVAPRRDAALFRKPQQQPQRLVGYAVLRVVEIKSRSFRHKPFATARILGEHLPQMQSLDLIVVDGKGLPSWRCGRFDKGHGLVPMGFDSLTWLRMQPRRTCSNR